MNDNDPFAIVFTIIFHPFVVMWMGQLLHMLKKLRDDEENGASLGLWTYIHTHPYRILFSVIAGIVVYGLLHTSHQINVASAFACGYMAESMIGAFTKKQLRAIGDSDEKTVDGEPISEKIEPAGPEDVRSEK